MQHPALTQPEIATGTVSVGDDGELVRDQLTPERQISEVGETMLSTRPAPDAEPTLYPIPAEARPMLLALRRTLAGNAEALAADFATDLAAEERGWRLDLRPLAETSGTAISLRGCGAELRTVEIVQPDGVRRTLAFFPAR